MSYYTRVELTWDDGDYVAGTLTKENIVAVAIPFVTEQGWGDDVLDDLAKAAGGQGLDHPGFNRLLAPELIALMMVISAGIPSVTFYARGVGEDLYDLWAVHLRAGDIRWQAGPFEPAE